LISIMLSRSSLAARVRNRLKRAVHRVPSGVVSPAIPDAVYQAHLSLFDFLGGFTVRREVLFVGNATAFGAHYIQTRNGAAHVTSLTPAAAALRYARKHFATGEVDYAASIDQTRRFDVVIVTEGPYERAITDAGRLQSEGKLLLSYPPGREPAHVVADLRSRFVNVRRFVHFGPDGLDLRDPRPSPHTPSTFRFVEIGDEETPPRNAVGVVLLATNDAKWTELRLHVGCGPVSLPGWVNLDNQPYAGIDFMWDASRGIPFRNARYVFAEHFIEHLSYTQGSAFVKLLRTVLREDGVLRMSTPNLDWVWHTSYHPGQWESGSDAQRECFVTNRAFRGWGHQFLYNLQTLTALLHNAGFEMVTPLTHGVSSNPDLHGLERHEKYPDTPEVPHVVVVEATGVRAVPPVAEGADLIAEYERDVNVV
jgi:predicted SAM-dependent methyltransferase